MSRVRPLVMAVILTALISGCATTSASSCRPGDSTVTCCIKKHPLSPAESCAASQREILEILIALSVAHEATKLTEDDDIDAIDDFANNADLPEWKQRCIRGYVDCQNKGWTGNCYDCLRRCEGQHDWPTSMCGPRGKRR